MVLLAMAAQYKELRHSELGELHVAQSNWHWEWAQSYDEWRLTKGMAPMDTRDYVWPVAPPIMTVA